MHLRLRNQNDSHKTIGMSQAAWYKMLELAEENGWNPMGSVESDAWECCEPGNYTPSTSNDSHGLPLVLLEDALNLADALEKAFLEQDRERVHYLAEITMAGKVRPIGTPAPSIGAIVALIEFCRLGSFWIEAA